MPTSGRTVPHDVSVVTPVWVEMGWALVCPVLPAWPGAVDAPRVGGGRSTSGSDRGGTLEAGEAGPYGCGAFPAQLVMPPLHGGSIVVVTDPPFSDTTPRHEPGPATTRTNTALIIIGCSAHEGRIACLV